MNNCALHALAALAMIQLISACKNCVMLGKEERAMFRVHSAACTRQSGVAPAAVEALLAGEVRDEPALRRHVYCVLLLCKLVGKDGKLLKAALAPKLAHRPDAKNTTKLLESCAEKAGGAASAEDVAWELFRCAYDRKAVLFDYMPRRDASAALHQ